MPQVPICEAPGAHLSHLNLSGWHCVPGSSPQTLALSSVAASPLPRIPTHHHPRWRDLLTTPLTTRWLPSRLTLSAICSHGHHGHSLLPRLPARPFLKHGVCSDHSPCKVFLLSDKVWDPCHCLGDSSRSGLSTPGAPLASPGLLSLHGHPRPLCSTVTFTFTPLTSPPTRGLLAISFPDRFLQS